MLTPSNISKTTLLPHVSDMLMGYWIGKVLYYYENSLIPEKTQKPLKLYNITVNNKLSMKCSDKSQTEGAVVHACSNHNVINVEMPPGKLRHQEIQGQK